jgi:hypothetical protein
MAKTALTELQDQIEAVRREAFAAGYAAAMQAIRDAASQPAPGAAPAAARASGRTPGRPAGRPRSAAPARAQSALSAPATGQLPTGRRRGPRAAAMAPQRGGRASAKRPQRGTNARLVAEVLQSNAPRALRPAEIRGALQRDKGVAMAFTSIRHALGQLEGSHTAEQVGDSKTWRHTGAPA